MDKAKADVDDADLDFQRAEISRSYEYDRNENSQLIGYDVNRRVEIRLRKLEAYEHFVAALARAGVSEINSPLADVDGRNSLNTLALKQPTLNAKHKAAAIAEGLEEVVVTGSRVNIADPLPFVPQKIKVTATAWVSFRISEDDQ